MITLPAPSILLIFSLSPEVILLFGNNKNLIGWSLIGILIIFQLSFARFTFARLSRFEKELASFEKIGGRDFKKDSEAQRISVSIGNAHTSGDKRAKVKIIEFSDFECPFCKQANKTKKIILSKYKGKVRLAFRHFPVTEIHPHAVNAALAAECAGEQDKFWDYHDILFDYQGTTADAFSLDNLIKYAQNLGLSVGQFKLCLQQKKYLSTIEKDWEDGKSYGVTGTPTFFINGRPVVGSQPIEVFDEIINEELQKS